MPFMVTDSFLSFPTRQKWKSTEERSDRHFWTNLSKEGCEKKQGVIEKTFTFTETNAFGLMAYDACVDGDINHYVFDIRRFFMRQIHDAG